MSKDYSFSQDGYVVGDTIAEAMSDAVHHGLFLDEIDDLPDDFGKAWRVKRTVTFHFSEAEEVK